MKRFAPLLLFVLRLGILGLIIKYIYIPGYHVAVTNTSTQHIIQTLSDHIWGNNVKNTDGSLVEGSNQIDNNIIDISVIDTNNEVFDHKEEISIDIVDEVMKGVIDGESEKLKVDNDVVINSPNDNKSPVEITEIFAQDDEPSGTYVYINTKLDLSDKKLVNDLKENLALIPSDGNVYLRPMGDEINDVGLTIRGGYMCSNAHTGYRPMIQYVMNQKNPEDRLFNQILSFGLTQEIQDFEKCYLLEANRGLILHRMKIQNKHSFGEDNSISLLRVLSREK